MPRLPPLLAALALLQVLHELRRRLAPHFGLLAALEPVWVGSAAFMLRGRSVAWGGRKDDTMEFAVLGRRTVISRDEAVVKQVLRERWDVFHRAARRFPDYDGVFFANKDVWKAHRALVAPALRPLDAGDFGDLAAHLRPGRVECAEACSALAGALLAHAFFAPGAPGVEREARLIVAETDRRYFTPFFLIRKMDGAADARCAAFFLRHCRPEFRGLAASASSIMPAFYLEIMVNCETLLLCLARNPACQQRVRDEVLGGGSAVQRQAFMRETGRLFTSIDLLATACAARTEIRGVPVRPGDSVVLDLQAVHARSAYGGTSPAGAFDPLRFVDGAGALKPDAMFTFGRFSRECPGRFLAGDILLRFVTDVVARYEVRAPQGLAEPERVRVAFTWQLAPFALEFVPLGA